MKKLLLALLLSCNTVSAAPVAIAKAEGVTVTLYNEPCAFTKVVALKNRATWEEKGVKYEGCFAVHIEAGAVVAYFSDKSIALFPAQIFAPLSSM